MVCITPKGVLFSREEGRLAMISRKVGALLILAGTGVLIWAVLPSAGSLYAVAILGLVLGSATVVWMGDSLARSARRRVGMAGSVLSVLALIGAVGGGIGPLMAVPFLAALGSYASIWRLSFRVDAGGLSPANRVHAAR